MTAATLRGDGCGAEGHPPVTVHDWLRAPLGAVLTAVFGWYAEGRLALLCGKCCGRLAKNRGRVRYSKSRPTDRRITR
jgi:hypothetical protein